MEHHKQLYEALDRIGEVRKIQKLIRMDNPANAEVDEDVPNCALDQSVEDMLDYTEQNSYETLLKELKSKGMHYFETPLICSDTSNIE